MVHQKVNNQEPRFFTLRVLFYSLCTALAFILSFTPVIIAFGWIFFLDFSLNVFSLKFWLMFFSPIILTAIYLMGWFTFIVIHSKVISPFFLVPVKAGIYPLSSKTTKLLAIRVSADQTARMMLIPLDFMPLVVNRYLRPIFFKCYGVKVGRNAYFSRVNKVDALPLIELGDNLKVGQLGVISCHYIAQQNLVLQKIIVGNNVTIGDYAIVLPGAILEDNTIIDPKTVVPRKHLPAGSRFYNAPGIEKISEENLS